MLIFPSQGGLWIRKGQVPVSLILDRSKQLPEHSQQRLCSYCSDLCGRGREGAWKLRTAGKCGKLCSNGGDVPWDLVPVPVVPTGSATMV